MEIQGCAFGRHEPEQSKPEPVKTSTPANVKVLYSEDGVEVYKNTDNIVPASSTKKEEEKPLVVEPPKPKEQPDPPDAVIPVGATCLHKGCNALYKDDSSRTEECIYHPGNPLFHEGSKGWDCCKKMTLIFDDFLSLEGCTVGIHKFVPEPKVSTVDVRYDYYQMGDWVIITFYSKNCDKTNSNVTFKPNEINVKLKLSDGQIFNKTISFAGGKIINHSASSFSILTTKVEIKLKKHATGGDWTRL